MRSLACLSGGLERSGGRCVNIKCSDTHYFTSLLKQAAEGFPGSALITVAFTDMHFNILSSLALIEKRGWEAKALIFFFMGCHAVWVSKNKLAMQDREDQALMNIMYSIFRALSWASVSGDENPKVMNNSYFQNLRLLCWKIHLSLHSL